MACLPILGWEKACKERPDQEGEILASSGLEWPEKLTNTQGLLHLHAPRWTAVLEGTPPGLRLKAGICFKPRHSQERLQLLMLYWLASTAGSRVQRISPVYIWHKYWNKHWPDSRKEPFKKNKDPKLNPCSPREALHSG